MLKVAVHNLGCKVNSYELDKIAGELLLRGFELVPFKEGADVYIINTCTVTNIADRKSRQMLHRAKKLNPKAFVVALGCYVDTSPDCQEKDSCIDLALSNKEKDKLPDVLDKWAKKETAVNMMQTAYHSRTRAYVKIQDGCNLFCTYCIIPFARGRSVSRPVSEILTEVEALAKSGVKEIVLTGIHISSYGLDLKADKKEDNQVCESRTGDSHCNQKSKPADFERRVDQSFLRDNEEKNVNLLEKSYDEQNSDGTESKEDTIKLKHELKREESEITALHDLVKKVNAVEGIERIRLGSLEPRTLTDEVLSTYRSCEKLCPHFHLSLQSGSDSVLERMHRRYTAAEYEQVVVKLRQIYDHPAITTDVITGFPGETEEEFEESRRFIEQIDFYETHVFPYSVRKGTKAEIMSGQHTARIKTQRAEVLIKMSVEHAKKYRQQFIGAPVRVLWEDEEDIDGRMYLVGHTERYVRVAVPIEKAERVVLKRTTANTSIQTEEDATIPVSGRITQVVPTGFLNHETLAAM